MSWLRCGTHVQVTASLTTLLLQTLYFLLYSPLCFSFLSLSIYNLPPPFLSFISAHMCVHTNWICLKGEEGGTKSAERTWQLLFSLSLHCFGPPQILFHGAKHPLPGISTAPISRRRFKPLSWHPNWAWRETACDAHQHRQRHKHTYYLCSERDRCPAVCAVLTHIILVSQAWLATFTNLWHKLRDHT